MSICRDLWQANQDLALACLDHPFVQGIAAGSLSRAQFAYYVGQDAFFLEAFARAYSIAAAKAPDWEGFGIFHRLAAGVLTELHLHQGYATAWQVDLQAVEPGTATRCYTDFLLATAWSSEVGLTAAAMTPCLRLYAFLGQKLAQDGIPDHAYSEWIHTYSDPAFEELAQYLEGLCDRYTTSTAQAQFNYHYAMQCEQNFFQAALELQN